MKKGKPEKDAISILALKEIARMADRYHAKAVLGFHGVVLKMRRGFIYTHRCLNYEDIAKAPEYPGAYAEGVLQLMKKELMHHDG